MNTIQYKKADQSDSQALKDLAKRVIRHNYVSFLGEEAVNAFIDSGMSDKEIDDGLDRCTVMLSDGAIIGFAIINDDLLHLIMVDVSYQHKGYGGQLLAYTENELFIHHDTIRLQSFKENADTVRFYLKSGWKITDQQEVPELGLIMLMFEKAGGNYEH